MKKKNLLYVSALCACMSFSFIGCSDDDDKQEIPSLPEQISLNGVYVLNSGKKWNNNSSLSINDIYTKKVEADIFNKVNLRG